MSGSTDLLQRVPLLRHLDAEGVERLALTTRRQSFRAGETIVEIGTPGRSLYLIVQGRVQVIYPSRSLDFELAQLGEGDFFGEMALLNDMPRSATVRALEPVETVVLDKQSFRRVVTDHPGLALQVMEALSIRIRNADEQISSLSDRAVRDPLTGLLNRRTFHERLDEEVSRARRYASTFTLLLLDLDRLSAIHDALGLEAGDEVLAWVARLLQEHTRDADVPFRIESGRFALICPLTAAWEARTAAKRLVAIVSGARPPLDHELNVTISAGYAVCPTAASDAAGLLEAAEKALRSAREAGPNGVGGAPD